MDQIHAVLGNAPYLSRLATNNGNLGTIWTVRSTARLKFADGRYSEVKRTAAAVVKFFPPGTTPPFHILRWYDEAPPAPLFRTMPAGPNQVVSLQ
jgi:hypothetical protein